MVPSINLVAAGSGVKLFAPEHLTVGDVGKRGVSWYRKYDDLDPATRQRIHKRISAKTRQERLQTLRAAIQAVGSGQIGADKRLTIREFVECWLASIEDSVWPPMPSTRRSRQHRRRSRQTRGKIP